MRAKNLEALKVSPVPARAFLRAATRLIVRIWTVQAQRAAERRSLDELRAMTDGQLKDIGLTRQDVWDITGSPHLRDGWDILVERRNEGRVDFGRSYAD